MFSPQAGHEQAGPGAALVSSPEQIKGNSDSPCPTRLLGQIKGYPFEVLIPAGLEVKGAISSDRVKSLDWKARKAEFSCKLTPEKLNEVVKKLANFD